MRNVLSALVCALVLPVAACSIDVHHSYRVNHAELPVYPDARPVEAHAPEANCQFYGQFCRDVRRAPNFRERRHPERILEFYRVAPGCRQE
jgi:hypothetical protein